MRRKSTTWVRTAIARGRSRERCWLTLILLKAARSSEVLPSMVTFLCHLGLKDESVCCVCVSVRRRPRDTSTRQTGNAKRGNDSIHANPFYPAPITITRSATLCHGRWPRWVLSAAATPGCRRGRCGATDSGARLARLLCPPRPCGAMQRVVSAALGRLDV